MSRSLDSSTLHAGIEKRSGSTNPNIRSLLDEIINDSSTDKSLSTIPQAIPKNILSKKTVLSKLPSPTEAAAVDVLPLTPPTEVVAAVF